MIRINHENYGQYFTENRTKYNHKVVIDQNSFMIRGLAVSSFGFTSFYPYVEKEIQSTFVINTTPSDNLEYSGLSISIVLTAIDREGFILQQSDALRRHNEVSIQLRAFSVDEAVQIRVSARGDIPYAYDAEELAQYKKLISQQHAQQVKYATIIQQITEHAGDYDKYKISGFIKSINHRIEEEAHKGRYFIQIGTGTTIPFFSSIVNIERACDELTDYYTDQGFFVSREGTKMQIAWKQGLQLPQSTRRTKLINIDI